MAIIEEGHRIVKRWTRNWESKGKWILRDSANEFADEFEKNSEGFLDELFKDFEVKMVKTINILETFINIIRNNLENVSVEAREVKEGYRKNHFTYILKILEYKTIWSNIEKLELM